jgi:hypothetical protein
MVRDSQNRDGTTGDKAGEHTDHERPVGLKVTVQDPYKLQGVEAGKCHNGYTLSPLLAPDG